MRKPVPPEERCQHKKYAGFHSFESCSFRAKLERNGKRYCTRHDPVNVAERRAKRDAAWKEKWEHDSAARAAAAAERQRRERLADCAEELLETAEALLACRWVRETVSEAVDNLRTAIAHAKGLQP